ncbi:MAG: UDP-3-O-(3-hydroxymyristoyl)glucosamine N-acyltransferase [Phycisphaeraceae bacterium]
MNPHTTQAIAQHIAGELVGRADLPVRGLETLDRADADHVTFIGDEKHARRWPESRAGAALVTRGLTPTQHNGDDRPLIYVDDADLATARALELFAPELPAPQPGIHPTAVVHEDARLGENVRLGPHCYVGPRARIGDRCILHANVTALDDARLGDDCALWPGTVIRERCTLGNRCICQPNVTIGADGFGYRPSPDGAGMVKIPQIGTVELGDDVELGAGTCIDRGKFSATVIGAGCKIDNLVQIAHNCRIGRSVVIAGNCGIAGSVIIEDGVMLGGMVAVKDHLTIGAGARLAGCAQVIHDVPPGETWAGSPAQRMRDAAAQAALLRKLPDLARQVRRLSRQ